MDQASYGTLARTDERTIEFYSGGRLLRTWRMAPPLESLTELLQYCLAVLGNEGWRPVTQQSEDPAGVVLTRVPYAAGARLPTFGVLRFPAGNVLVLSISGATMRKWEGGRRGELIQTAISELTTEGWRLERQFEDGAILVRG